MSRIILRLEQISERTGVPVATLRYWRHLGIELPTFRLGRRVVAYEDEVDRWVEAKRAQAGQPQGAA
jgi:DNA-binding transcriptional MerR regulator